MAVQFTPEQLRMILKIFGMSDGYTAEQAQDFYNQVRARAGEYTLGLLFDYSKGEDTTNPEVWRTKLAEAVKRVVSTPGQEIPSEMAKLVVQVVRVIQNMTTFADWLEQKFQEFLQTPEGVEAVSSAITGTVQDLPDFRANAVEALISSLKEQDEEGLEQVKSVIAIIFGLDETKKIIVQAEAKYAQSLPKGDTRDIKPCSQK